jgi:hypothetical protein
MLKMLERRRDGRWSAAWFIASSSTDKAGLVTVAGKPGDDVASGTLNSILKQAGLKP